MVALVNTSNYPAFGFEHRLLVGNPYFITILKQSFALQPNGKLKELEEQIDIRLHDIVQDNARFDSVRYPSDLIPYKPKPEVILNGIAQNTLEKQQWICSIDIKQLKENNDINSWSKQILVTGNRIWQHQDNTWKLSNIEPTTHIRLTYENAYGGHFLYKSDNDSNEDKTNLINDLSYPLNPSGKGWLPSKDNISSLSDKHQQKIKTQLNTLDSIPAPQLFLINPKTNQVMDNLESPYHSVPVAGFGSYTNFWEIRTQYLDNDLDWSDESTDGGYPADFDMRHWQQASSDQWLDFELKGGEILTLTGFFPEGTQSYTLPTSIAYLLVREPEQLVMNLDMDIDTLVIDTEKRTLEIIWRRIVLLTDLDPDTLIECNAFITNNFRRL